MKKLISLFFFSCLFFLLLFFLFGGYEEGLTQLVESRQNKSIYWIISFVVLASDIIIPVPSSLVMIMNGKVLGVLFGTLLSTFAGLLSSTIGFFVGRKLGPVTDRFFGEREKSVSSRLFLRYGKLAIIVSKALPIISEAVSFLSGTTPISFKRFLLFSFGGHLAISAVYAYVGSFANDIDSNLWAGIVTLLVVLLFLGIDKLVQRKTLREE